MVTPDKDYGQLVSDKIKIYKPAYQGNDAEILGPEEVCAKWNIKSVEQVIDMLGMMGDAVDNIPGIPGVGEKLLLSFWPNMVHLKIHWLMPTTSKEQWAKK
jgi:DNA polymerase-1